MTFADAQSETRMSRARRYFGDCEPLSTRASLRCSVGSWWVVLFDQAGDVASEVATPRRFECRASNLKDQGERPTLLPIGDVYAIAGIRESRLAGREDTPEGCRSGVAKRCES